MTDNIKTSNHQRLQEMLIHLTPLGAVVPYNLCIDPDNNYWIASKGGLFKVSWDGSKLLYENKNLFPKRMAPYTQIIYASTDDKANTTDIQILDLNGKLIDQHIMDGKIQSLVVNSIGDLFMTKQIITGKSCIYKSSINCLIAWDELISTEDYAFQNLCIFDDKTLAVAITSVPINLYSKQTIKWISVENGSILSSFSSTGKDNGLIFFPRCMQKYNDGLTIMDKTGRLQLFNKLGEFVKVLARIDAYIGNGFVIRDDEAVIACSGIDNENICDDWIEAIKLNGSSWTQTQ